MYAHCFDAAILGWRSLLPYSFRFLSFTLEYALHCYSSLYVIGSDVETSCSFLSSDCLLTSNHSQSALPSAVERRSLNAFHESLSVGSSSTLRQPLPNIYSVVLCVQCWTESAERSILSQVRFTFLSATSIRPYLCCMISLTLGAVSRTSPVSPIAPPGDQPTLIRRPTCHITTSALTKVSRGLCLHSAVPPIRQRTPVRPR